MIDKAAMASRGTLRSVAWPTDLTADWTVTFAGKQGPGATVKVADDTGTALAAPVRPQGGVARLMRRIHDGTGMGACGRRSSSSAGCCPRCWR